MKRFEDLRDKLTPSVRRRIDARARETVKEMGLDELRRARRMSQDELARTMETTQAHVSRLERRVYLYLSTLPRYIRALGGSFVSLRRSMMAGTASWRSSSSPTSSRPAGMPMPGTGSPSPI